MGDHQQRPLVGGEVILQPPQGSKIQVVGGLVQDEEAGLLQQELGDGKAGLLPPAELINLLIKAMLRKAHTGEDGIDFHLDLVAVPGQKRVLQFSITLSQGNILRLLRHFLRGFLHFFFQLVDIGKDGAHLLQDRIPLLEAGVLPLVADGKATPPDHRPLIRQKLPGDDIQQGGLPRSIDTHQADAVPVLDAGGDLPEDEVAAKGLPNIFQRYLQGGSLSFRSSTGLV